MFYDAVKDSSLPEIYWLVHVCLSYGQRSGLDRPGDLWMWGGGLVEGHSEGPTRVL